jgi:hypothetical protein
MGLIVLEALVALGIVVLFVWWTMFSGRRDAAGRDERDHTEDSGR